MSCYSYWNKASIKLFDGKLILRIILDLYLEMMTSESQF